MAKKHMVKCKYCGEYFDANIEEFVKPSANRYAHKKCAEEYEANLTEEERDKNEFYAYLKQLFKNYDYVKTNRLINQYIEKYEYTYSGMTKALKWYYEIQKHPVDKANGSVGILPYIYQQAYDYYYALYLNQLVNKEKDISIYIPKAKKIEIESPRVYVKPHRLFMMEDDE